MESADAQFGGVWELGTLTGTAALAVVLPPHAGEPCRGDRLALVDPGGATVREAAERLMQIAAAYEQNSPSCWGRIQAAVAAPFSTLILTTSPIDTDEYRTIRPAADCLYHLDGFHRLVGWAWTGRLTADARIPAIVAGGFPTGRQVSSADTSVP